MGATEIKANHNAHCYDPMACCWGDKEIDRLILEVRAEMPCYNFVHEHFGELVRVGDLLDERPCIDDPAPWPSMNILCDSCSARLELAKQPVEVA